MFVCSVNCNYAKCEEIVPTSSSLRSPFFDNLMILLDDGNWFPTSFNIPVMGNILEYQTPLNRMEIINLIGCRANLLSLRTQAAIQRTGPAALACFELNCTYTAQPTYLCASEDSKTTASAWMSAINKASHPSHIIDKFEVIVKTAEALSMEGRRKASLYEQPAYREAWALSYLSELSANNRSGDILYTHLVSHAQVIIHFLAICLALRIFLCCMVLRCV